MANPNDDAALQPISTSSTRILSFEVEGLLGGPEIKIDFPQSTAGSAEPSILILSGRNGTGKTTILRMIAGMLELDFNVFRRIPFASATLHLSSGDVLDTRRSDNAQFPLTMSWNGQSIKLPKEQGAREDEQHDAAIDAIRKLALPRLRSISYEFLELDRLPVQERLTPQEKAILESYSGGKRHVRDRKTAAQRVAEFIRDAQVNYRRFFREEELGFLPRILSRLNPQGATATSAEIISRIQDIRAKYEPTKRFGLHLEEEQLEILESLLMSGDYESPQQIALIETYVESQENAQTARDLIAHRLTNFEEIMADFLIGKSVEVDSERGLIIRANRAVLSEQQLSSGEYHFLYMMVSALLCQRAGSVIAIDEPELSLHVSWQRKLISALASCASGASPTLLFATHSLAISSSYIDQTIQLSSLD